MIGFLHPWLLVGLAAAGIPIVLHLLERREPPTVVFPAVRYLIAATERHQRRLRLQNWLLLLLRTLLIVFLVLAAAGPDRRAQAVVAGRGREGGHVLMPRFRRKQQGPSRSERDLEVLAPADHPGRLLANRLLGDLKRKLGTT